MYIYVTALGWEKFMTGWYPGLVLGSVAYLEFINFDGIREGGRLCRGSYRRVCVCCLYYGSCCILGICLVCVLRQLLHRRGICFSLLVSAEILECHVQSDRNNRLVPNYANKAVP